MQQHIHTIVKHFFQKDSLQDVPEHALQQFTEDHPYSAVGHWLLAKKVHDTAPARSEAQSANAAAWFNNPLWLHWTLQEHEMVTETLLIPSTPKEEPVQARSVTPPVISEPIIVAPPQPEPPAIEAIAPPVPEVLSAIPAATGEENELQETEILIPGVSEPISLLEETPPPTPPVEEVAAAAPPSVEVPASTGAELTDTFKPVISESEEPIFEPYHTIDYFASQGIKLRQEDLKDKLGIQLKSFTEWLRSMKRVAPVMPEEPAPAFDETLQQSIQEIAGHSVEGKDIITEAMAEVWVKQGSKQKAIAIYEKLSLLNPAKSPYFVARIDQIKAM
jgi:hypothetical protein